MANSTATLHLARQLKELQKRPDSGFSAGLYEDGNLFDWSVTIFGPPDTLYDGAILKCRMTFPQDFPLSPPELKFESSMWHPSVYSDGKLCISILHPPGDDPMNPFESSGERWLPIHTVESILVSVISLLSANPPSTESPANVDAAKQVREDLPGYQKKVRRLARKSAEAAYD